MQVVVTDTGFERASKSGAQRGTLSAQKAPQHTHAAYCVESQKTKQALGERGLVLHAANRGDTVQKSRSEAAGIQPPQETPGKTALPAPGGAESGARGAREARPSPDLAAVVDAWPTLSAAINSRILAMVRAGGAGGSAT